jgi:methylated-DNA-[protein]-cysteine S-methyltransferase
VEIIYEMTGSPVGDLFLAEADGEPVAVLFRKGGKLKGFADWLEKTYPEDSLTAGPCAETRYRLEDYFAGRSRRDRFPKNLRGTPFEISVWKEIAKISFGVTTTYGEIASKLGRSQGSRAVGAATGRNPVAILIPCHRVVGSRGNLTGYGGGMSTKIWLLRHEGVLMAL